jgi:hypothetical protein
MQSGVGRDRPRKTQLLLQDNRCAIDWCRKGDRSCSECHTRKLPQLMAQMTAVVEFAQGT